MITSLLLDITIFTLFSLLAPLGTINPIHWDLIPLLPSEANKMTLKD